MNTLTCDKTHELVQCLELVDQVRETLAATPNIAGPSAHETAVISATSLAEAIELMISDRENRHTVNGRDMVVGDVELIAVQSPGVW